MHHPPITVLDKTLRTGQHLILTYGRGGFTATVDGDQACARFSTWARRDVVADPVTPHVIEIPRIPGATRTPGAFGVPVGLTEAEADAVDGARTEYEQGPVRRARAAAPHAATWTTPGQAFHPAPGTTYREGDGRAVTVLSVRKVWIDGDGRSFHLDQEDGYVEEGTVREATPSEVAHLEAHQAQDARIAAAWRRVEEVFTWGPSATPGPGVMGAGYEDTAGGERLDLGMAGPGALVRHAGRIVTAVAGTSVLHPSAYWSHERTAERDEVFDALTLSRATRLG